MIFDCLGAGQRVVQEIYAGRSWREDPDLLPGMWSTLTALRGVHELILLLATAAKAPLAKEERATLETLQAELEPVEGWTAQSLEAFGQGTLARRVREFLPSLQRHFRR